MYALMMSFFVAITLCNQCLLQNDKWRQKVVYFQCRLVVFTKQDGVCGIDTKLIITVLVFITIGRTLVFFFFNSLTLQACSREEKYKSVCTLSILTLQTIHRITVGSGLFVGFVDNKKKVQNVAGLSFKVIEQYSWRQMGSDSFIAFQRKSDARKIEAVTLYVSLL